MAQMDTDGGVLKEPSVFICGYLCSSVDFW
jgi:hypothetical protein